MGQRFLFAGAVALMVTPVVAQTLADFVPPRDGAITCWQRSYSEAHLAGHKDQMVTEMTFGMIYRAADAEYSEQVAFGMDVTLRDGRSGQAGGPCYENGNAIECGVECDGGGFVLEKRADGNLLLDLEQRGYVRVLGECSSGDEEASFDLEAGKDDKQFLLHKTDAKICKGLLAGW